jgi:diguanylate cyclase (GGDEF)-like protein
MIKPLKPKNESQRLKALYSLNILDTQSEERFDRITRIAQNLFDVPIVSVSFVDKEREWFKSKYGLAFEETPRELSFGAHVILQPDIMIVQDTFNDVRFKDNPLIISNPNIRYYLGMPIRINGQFNIGTLCLIDHKFQNYNAFDLNIFRELATTIETEFEENHLTTIDELTMLSNREGFTMFGKKIIKHCNQYDKNVLLIYFDLKNFKLINKKYGFDEGDHLLQIFSQQLLRSFRKTDAIARLGGDKFCVLCSGMFKEHIPNVLNRLNKKLTSIKTKHRLEFNMGTVQYNRWKHNSIYSLIEEAYKNIYQFKQQNLH